MTGKLQAYAEYKDSGALWLGKVPAHWEIRKIKYLFNERVQKGFPEEPLLAATQTKGVVPKEHYENRTVVAQKDLHLLKLVKKGDFVISLRSFQGGIEYSGYRGIISPAYTVMILRDVIDSGYFKHLAKSKPFIGLLKTCVTGIRQGQNIDYEILKRSFLPLPTIEEQRIIANFLNHRVSKINHFIRAKRQMVELLKEEAYNIVLSGSGHSGLQRDVKFWEYIPSHWKFQKAKRLFSERNTRNAITEALLAVTQDRGVIPKDMCEQNYVSPSGDLSNLKLVKKNDYVISLRSFQGGIEHSDYEGIVSPAYNVFSLRDKYKSYELQMYYKYLFKTKTFISLLNTIISGIRDGKNINYRDFSEITVPVPPKEDIDKFIPIFIQLEKYKENFELEKKIINEFKARLISDVVTGKVDVRDIQVEPVEDIEEIEELEDAIVGVGEELEEAIDE